MIDADDHLSGSRLDFPAWCVLVGWDVCLSLRNGLMAPFSVSRGTAHTAVDSFCRANPAYLFFSGIHLTDFTGKGCAVVMVVLRKTPLSSLKFQGWLGNN